MSVFRSGDISKFMALYAATDKPLAPQNRIHGWQEFTSSVGFVNVTQSARGQSRLHNVQRIVLA